MAKVTSRTETPLTYDPMKNYTWDPTDSFHLDGLEFAAIYQALKNEVYIPGGTSAKQKVAAFDILEGIMLQAVLAGVAKEQLPLPQDTIEGN